VEKESHYYNVVRTELVELGLQPHRLGDTLIESLFTIVARHRHRANLDAMRPTINWRQPVAELLPAPGRFGQLREPPQGGRNSPTVPG
jgi:UDP-sulfoquinovose synthase